MTIKVTWLSHSAFSLDIDGTKVLIDPYLTHNPLAAADPKKVPADYILVTHGHGDHLGDTVDIAKRTNAQVIGMVELCSWVEARGVKRVSGQNIGGGYQYPFGYVKMVRADHSSSLPDGSYGGLACGYVLTIQGKKLYFSGDTSLFTEMQMIGDMGIEIAFLPIGDYYTMGPDDALDALKLIKPRRVFPMHYNTFPVIHQDVSGWAQRVTNETPVQAIVVDPGHVFTV